MSARLSQANRMVRAAEQAGVQLMVNWPNAWSPAWQEFERMLRAAQARADAAGDIDWLVSVDSTVVRAHQHAAGARKGGSAARPSAGPAAG